MGLNGFLVGQQTKGTTGSAMSEIQLPGKTKIYLSLISIAKPPHCGVSKALECFAALHISQHTVKWCRNTRLVLCCLVISE